MTAPRPAPKLRGDLPYRRVAVVLSGGGALGAYEAGVLRVLEALRVVPSCVAGVSAGAINAIVWLAHGRRTGPLAEAWRTLRGPDLGFGWVSLAMRVAGAFAAGIAVLEVVLSLLGSRELSGSYWLWKQSSARIDLLSTQLDIGCWTALAVVGALLALFSRRAARWLPDMLARGTPEQARARLGRIALGAALLHFAFWGMGWAWPHRFSASMVLLLVLAWVGGGPGRSGRWLRDLALGLMPETGGRGLWSGRARRRVLERLVANGDRAAVAGADTRLIVSALAVDTGRVCHFISWPHPAPEFVARLEAELGEVVSVHDADEMIAAVVASSAIPGLFEPERIGGRDFVDAGGFSNQPLHVAIASGADAVLVVLLTPSGSPAPAPPPPDVASLGGRLLELANWRDLQTELRALPAGWSRSGAPANVCVVEPARPLPAALLEFSAEQSERLMALGERDATEALARAGWLDDAGV